MGAVANESDVELTAPISIIGDEENRNHAAPDEAELKTTAAIRHNTASSLRRRACDACRARKVRCDGQDPPCSRCAKVGVSCRYSSRPKATHSKMDMSKFLVTLNNRLEQAEAQLASARSMQQNQQQVSMPWADVGIGLPIPTSSPHTNLQREVASSHLSSAPPTSTYDLQELGILHDEVLAQQTTTDWFNQTIATTATASTTEALEFSPHNAFTASMPADIMMTQALPDNQSFEFEPMFFDIPSPPTKLVPAMSATILQGLYDRYFEIFHPIIPIINRTRFQHEVSQLSPSVEVQALSYAMGALTAFSVPELQHYEKHYHEQARNLIEICERDESGESLSNVNIMQAYVVLTFYELKQPNFARAWLTLGRAIRLAKMMGLDSAKDDSGMSAQLGLRKQWGLRKQLIQPTNPADQEERRRVFWSLFIFDAFASLRVNTGLAFDGVINVPLPSSSEYPDHLNEKTLRLQQVFELTETAPLSSFAADTVMICLYQRYYKHIRSSYNETSHGFWETHYAIAKAIEHCRTTLLAPHMNGNSGDDPMAIGLRMNLNTLKINLHEAALFKIEKDQLPENLATDANSNCVSAVTDIVKAVQVGVQLTGNKMVTFRQLDRFFVWPITTSIQVCFRMLYGGKNDATPYISFLRILSSAMTELVDPEHIAPGLLENAEKMAETAQNTWNRRTFNNEL